ncbi:MAG: outer membrane protein transport protein [Polyangiaceae bacterium]|nr:outer membrane protein transport protein [Polyangiaceae bacterium]
MQRSSVLLALALLAVAPAARAGGGYFSGHKSARVTGRGGAFTAKADDLSAVLYNPAGLGHLDEPTLQVGNRFTYNAQEYTRAPTLDEGLPDTPLTTFEPVENETPWQVIEPFIGFGTHLGLEDWTFSLAAFAPPGIGRERFRLAGGQRYMMVRRNTQILSYALSAAWHQSDRFGVGLSFHWIDVSKLEYSLVLDGRTLSGPLAYPVSSPFDIRAKISGVDHFTPNAVLGAWFRPVRSLEIGLAAQVIPATIRTKSTLDVTALGEELIRSVGTSDITLSRDGEVADDVTLTLPLPLTARAGVRYFQTKGEVESFDVELDLVYESWSFVDHFELDSHGIVAELGDTGSIDVGVIEIEKNWRDTVSVHLGGDYALLPNAVTLRAGAAFESAVAKPEFAHVDFITGSQLTGSLGASLFAGPIEVAVAYGYLHQLTVDVSEQEGRVYQVVPGSPCVAPYTDPSTCNDAYLGQPSPTVNGGEYRAHSHLAALDLLYRF